MVLSIFDQTRKDSTDNRLLRIDDTVYRDDAEMNHILHRLTMAAADANMRHKMNVEDEYFSAIEKRDTEILMRDKQLAEQKTQIDEQKTQIDEQKTQIDEQKTQIDEQNRQLNEQENLLRLTIKMLKDTGSSIEEIAASLGKNIELIKRLCTEQ